MRNEHRDAPWFVTPPQMSTTTAEVTNKPPPFASFSAPLPSPALAIPHQEEPMADTLPFMAEEEDSATLESASASQEWVFTPEDIKEDTEWKAHRVTRWELSKDKMKEYMLFAPSDTHQYDYAGNARSGIMTRYRKDDSKTCSLSQAVSQDLAPPAPTPALEPGKSLP